MKVRYAFDACSFIELYDLYYPENPLFSKLWDVIEKLLDDEIIISSREILEEIHDTDITDKLKAHNKNFKPLSKEIQEECRAILKKYPQMIKIKSKHNSNGDPFLIATAKLEGCIIVTEEKSDDFNDPNSYKIPKVCKKLGIMCINLKQFLDIIGSVGSSLEIESFYEFTDMSAGR